MIYFIVTVDLIEDKNNYQEYIRQVKPIVEEYGGRYLVRSNKITAMQEQWCPRRVIIIEWDAKEQMEKCFSSESYKQIVNKRENSVDSKAIIVEV